MRSTNLRNLFKICYSFIHLLTVRFQKRSFFKFSDLGFTPISDFSHNFLTKLRRKTLQKDV